MEFKRLSDVKFMLERDAGKGMNANVVMYLDERMLEKVKNDGTVQQAINVSTLPGIVGDVLVMPDAHAGYGMPIGGVVAFDANEGIVSPGAVGFDINCLTPDTLVLDSNGARHRICDMREEHAHLVTFDLNTSTQSESAPILFMEKQNDRKVFRITTALGKELVATADHPILTDRGMLPIAELKVGGKVAVTGFIGVDFVRPIERVILSEERLSATLEEFGISRKGNALAQVLNILRKRGLNNVTTTHQKLPILLKLLGFVIGDGTISKTKGAISYSIFYGKKEDLLMVKRDIELLGFRAGMYHRKRHHKITTAYGTTEFDYEEHSLKVSAAAFSALLVCLGAPIGNKSTQAYRVPEWVANSENWQKRLFLSAYFGAEMGTPQAFANGYNFHMPAFSVKKLEELGDNAVAFLSDIRKMLESLGVSTLEPAIVEGYRYAGKWGGTVGFRLGILSNTENLIKFFGTVGYTYNKDKERAASLAALYLTYLKRLRGTRDSSRKMAVEMKQNGSSKEKIVQELMQEEVSRSFLEHAFDGRTGNARIWKDYKFSEFTSKNAIGDGGFALDEISKIEEVAYNGNVFDLTVNNANHNFVANGIVVSNCGVRLIKTGLSEKEVRPALGKLLDTLFKNVPSGVGSRFKAGFTQNDLEKVAELGAEYAIENGYGWANDVERIEENGRMQGADFSAVSSEARKRGLDQLGTLGAGNHFLEVQRVGQVFDEKTASAYGLELGQVLVMVHTGSRGFGHQICSDYLRTLNEYQEKNKMQLVDKELSYARIGSREADSYLAAMNGAANYAFANRQIIMHNVRKSFEEVFGRSADALGMELLYDVAHNIVKKEEHTVGGRRMQVYVHRKGATRAFPKGREEVPKEYRSVGQPVLIPGSMGTASYVLCGQEGSMKETFGTTCHGAGRVMSRHEAIRTIPEGKTFGSLSSKGIEIRVRSRKLVSEEAEWAYKNVDEVVGVVEKAGLSKIVTKNVPIGVVKG